MGRENGAGEANRTFGLRETMDHATATTSWVWQKNGESINVLNISWDIYPEILLEILRLIIYESVNGVLITSIVNIWDESRRWRRHHKCIEILDAQREQWLTDKGIAQTCWDTLNLAFATTFAFTGVLIERYLSGGPVCHHCKSNRSAEIWCARLQLLKHHINNSRIKINQDHPKSIEIFHDIPQIICLQTGSNTYGIMQQYPHVRARHSWRKARSRHDARRFHHGSPRLGAAGFIRQRHINHLTQKHPTSSGKLGARLS